MHFLENHRIPYVLTIVIAFRSKRENGILSGFNMPSVKEDDRQYKYIIDSRRFWNLTGDFIKNPLSC